MDVISFFNYQANWLNVIDFISWLIISASTLATIFKGADNIKTMGKGCYYSIRLLMFGILFHSLWQIYQLTLMPYMVTAADVSFHALIAVLFIWTIYFHRTKTTHWKNNELHRQSPSLGGNAIRASPTT